MEKVISVKNLKKEYRLGQISGKTLKSDIGRLFKKDSVRKFEALKGISFDVQKGEKIGIIGSNGAGKSTLLKLISRITAPSEGSISLKGRVTGMLEIGAGFNGELTGRENVYLNGAILGMSKKEIDSKLSDIIEFSECEEFIDTPVKRYSSGMFVKLAFSVAAHLDADIILMDEVLAVGDAAFQQKCVEKMNSLAKDKGKTILFVSHNMNTIKELCDRCIVLKQGEIVFDGETEKGISMYLENSFNNSELERDEASMTSAIRISSVELFKSNLPFGKNLELALKFEAHEKVDDMYLAFTFTNEDNVKAGTSVTTSLGSFKENNTVEKQFCIDTKNLPCGKYRASIAAVEPLSSTTLNRLDEVFNAFSFEIEGEEKTSGLTTAWQKDLWGGTILPSAEIK